MTTQKEMQQLDSQFVDVMKSKLDLYWQATKVMLPESSSKIEFYVGQDRPSARTEIAELYNWKNFKKLSEIESIVIELAEEAAITVEALLRMEAGKFGNNHDVRNLHCTDLFSEANGTRNLAVHIVTNTPASVNRPYDAPEEGWVSYKFKWACGFPSKATILYGAEKVS